MAKKAGAASHHKAIASHHDMVSMRHAKIADHHRAIADIGAPGSMPKNVSTKGGAGRKEKVPTKGPRK